MPDESRLTPQEASIIREELKRLDDKELLAITMRTDRCTHDEIGQALECSEETARQILLKVYR